ncbi:MAG: energy transducer TonB [candidate division WOR-3 bacterium]|nr:energy transducer TonB [candidate division WOR-3 bacterium]
MRSAVLLCLLLAGAVASPETGAVHGTATSDRGGAVVSRERQTDVKGSTSAIPVIPLWGIEPRPQPVSIPDAEYPEVARMARKEGLVVVEALVDVDGSVADARILRSSGNESLDQAAVAATRKAKFSPARGHGEAERMWITIPYRFVLTSGKGAAAAKSVSLVTTEVTRRPPDAGSHNDSVLKPLHGLHFVRLKPIAPRGTAHGRPVPDSAAIRFNNEAMTAAFAAFEDREGDSLRKPASYYLQSDWYYLVIDSGRCRVFQRNHRHYPSSRAEVYNVNTLAAKPGSLDTGYVEMPAWTSLPQYVPLKLEFDGERIRRTIQAPTFRLKVR